MTPRGAMALRAAVLWAAVAFAATALLGGCDDDVQVGAAPKPASEAPPAKGAKAPAPAKGAAPQAPGAAPIEEDTPDAAVALPTFSDDDFVETEANRDPFRSYATQFQARPTAVPQRTVLMPTTALDEMRLIAIVSGVAKPRAMLTDRSGVGHVVTRGDYVGRPEVVQAGGPDGMAVTLNWRIDRIRPEELVLTREDPSGPERPPLSRLLPLHEDTGAKAKL